MQPFSRHVGFFASLKRVEDRLAAEQQPPAAAAKQPEPLPFSDTMTASPLFLGPATDTASADRPGGESSGPAVDFLTLSKDEEPQGGAIEDDGDESGEDIERLMALLGLSPPRAGSESARHDAGDDDDSGGCDCSGGDGFLAKVVGVVGPKCDKEKKRVGGWVEHYFRDGECREPARLAHLLLGKASWSWEEGHRGSSPIAFPATVKEFLDRDAPRRWTE
ncbi:hypothetical protein E2562_021000 [Oryza meyeriana var. granulata]|uniref:Uncharacterized protein n=1 Tax=Oryza meyeriana var. granulata TaxID=110450 RepID=A0A6G1DYQ8_9ORYZ|nr:hypothetical protein E2562_021000 [Oryza meyeriana var. granulata]